MAFKKFINLTHLTLLVALSLSTVAAYYSIIGLTAIFAGAVIPVIIMGSILEVGKITTTVWLRKYWKQASWVLKLYLVPAVLALALLTSMGIFGFLSKAHMDSGLVSGDVQAKLSLLDEKIKTQRENVELARKALQQMDAQVDARLTRGDSENSAERAVQIRRQQAGERAKLQKDIGEAQKEIAKLNEERAPIAAENRKVEAEVGPIKYIAALIYGDNPDANVLERAVRWVIILLVAVFDPLAIALVLAANASKEWDKFVVEEKPVVTTPVEPESLDKTHMTPWPTEWTESEPEVKEEPKVSGEEISAVLDGLTKVKIDDDEFDISKHPYLFKGGFGFKNDVPIQVYKPEEVKVEPVVESDPTIECYNCGTVLLNAPGIGPFCPNKDCHVGDAPYGSIEFEESVTEEQVKNIEKKFAIISALNSDTPVGEPIIEEPIIEPTIVEEPTVEEPVSQEPEITESVPEEPTIVEEVKPVEVEIKTEGVTKEKAFKESEGGYVSYEGKLMHKEALKQMRPDLFMLTADSMDSIKTNFGTQFPRLAHRGDIFVRVDTLPNKVYKFDGNKWLEMNKETSGSYLKDDNYMQFLVSKINSGEYDSEMLSDREKEQIESYLKTQK